MEPQVELMDLVVDTVMRECGFQISLESLPDGDGIYAEITPGYPETEYYDRRAVYVIPVLFVEKHTDQQQCLNDLSKICNSLSGIKRYPEGKTMVWLNAQTATAPSKIGRQEDGKYLYSCIVNMKCYY